MNKRIRKKQAVRKARELAERYGRHLGGTRCSLVFRDHNDKIVAQAHVTRISKEGPTEAFPVEFFAQARLRLEK